jgi:hypothetical protein
VASNSKNLLDEKAFLRYDWSNNTERILKRGRALIFHDKEHSGAALKLQVSFEHLNYWTRNFSVSKVLNILGKYRI